MTNYEKEIDEYYRIEIETLKKLNLSEINEAMNAILECYKNDGTIYICGNGGSATTASHMACDFNKGVNEYLDDKKIRFVSLCDNIAIMTAISNDISYEDVFVHQIEKKLFSNDILIVISGSGNSRNIIKVLEYAKSQRCKTIAISGYNGGKIKELADYNMHVPLNDMMKVEDIHMSFDHMIATIFINHLK